MFRVMWRFPLWAPTTSVQSAPTATESWAWPVTFGRSSSHTIALDPIDWVESGHKE